MTTGLRGQAKGRGSGGLRALWLCLATLVAVVALAPAAAAIKAIEIDTEVERVDITGLGEAYEGRGDNLRIETAPGADRTAGTMSVRAVTPGTSPSWFVFAINNPTDKTLERWLVADRYSAVGSGVVWPGLDARRIDAVTPSLGYVPERIKNDRADVFRLSVEPGQTVTFAAELLSDRFTRLYLWKPVEYEQRARDRQLFNGILLGITGLLAIFLTVVFAANHKAIFPTAAIFTWCVLAYLCVDFGFWHKLFNMRPEDTAQYRAAAEAAMAGSLLVFLYTFLRLSSWHGFVRSLLALWMAAQLVLVAVAFLDPRLAATFARLSSIAIGCVGAGLILFLALRGQDRALSLVPSWMLLMVWLFGAGATFTGRLAGEIVVFGLSAGLVLIVVLIGFTVTQYAFRSFEPLYGAQPDDEKLRSLAVDGAGAAVWEWSPRRDEIKLSPVVEAILGLKAGTLSARTTEFLRHMHPADAERLKVLMWSVREHPGGEMRLDFRMRHADNSYRWFELEAASVPVSDRRQLRYVGLMREVTDSKRAQERLMFDAVNDSLTGLPNRELFLDRLAIAAKRATLEPLVRPALLFIDLDRFRAVNAAHGPVVGDSLLLTVARRLGRHLGPNDTLARVGGNQFALLLLNQSEPRELAILAEQVRRSLRAPIDISGQDIVLTASIGISLYDGPDEDPAELLREAMIAMYRAKRLGTDRIEIFSVQMRADKDGRVALDAELRRAIEKKQIRVVYQPVFYLATEVLAGFEAQLYWDHPAQGTLDAGQFMPIAEDSDLIVGLGSFALTEGLREVARWHKELPRPELPLYVGINITSRQLFRPELAQEVRRLLARAVVPKGSLRLEIPEALVMDNPEKATNLLAQLADAGAGLSLDDFGTGYSSLSYLNQFTFDAVKVDRAFIQAGAQNGSGSVILRSVIALCHELGKTVVTEGVESEEDVAFLRAIGCEYGQGPYFGEALSEREVMQLVKTARKVERRQKKGTLFRRRQRPAEDAPALEPAPVLPPAPVAAAPPRALLPRPPAAPPQPRKMPVVAPAPVRGREGERRPPPLPPARPGAVPVPPPGSRAGGGRGAMPMPAPPKPMRGGPPPVAAAPPKAPAPPPPRANPTPPPRTAPPVQPPVAAARREERPAAAPPPPLPPLPPPPLPRGSAAAAPRPAPTAPPAYANGRPAGADFSTLPPAIAESLARLAGRQNQPPVPREVVKSDAAANGKEPPRKADGV
ncbi:MAG TPA: EAL domain-containing protein [Hyphomicrobiaceae bacterium]|nr:EAL domain-containing protein [Hyphomicrobiaceae bacterium]